MLNVGFKNRYQISSLNKTTNKTIKGISDSTCIHKRQNDAFIPFKGNINFVLVNKCASPKNLNTELNHISNVLKTLGVKELEIGDNVNLANLLKSAMLRVRKLGFDIPSKIRCEAEFFKDNPEIQEISQKFINKHRGITKPVVPGLVSWEGIGEPVLYLNTAIDWQLGNGAGSKVQDLRHTIWHETGHYLHMLNHKNNPQMYGFLQQIELDPYQKNIVKDVIGIYAADNPVSETIPEIFSRLMSGESYNQLHPEIFNIYSKYRGPMPNSRNGTKI